MKIFLTVILLISALSASAQSYLYPESSEIRNLVVENSAAGFAYCQADQEILYTKFLDSSRTQLIYLLEVIGEEEAYSYRRNSYIELLRQKVLLHILVDQLNKRMRSKSLFKLHEAAKSNLQKSVMGLDGVKLELGDEITKTLDKVLTYRRFMNLAYEQIKEDLLKDTLKDLAKGALKAFISGAAQKTIGNILAGRVTQEAFKKAMLTTGVNMSTHILVGVAESSLISALTFPLHGYRLSDEDMWLDLTQKASMLLLNPDWKAEPLYGHRAANDWQIHCWTMIWKPERIEFIFNKLLKTNESRFYSSVQVIQTSMDFYHPKPVHRPLPADGTRVSPHIF